MMESKRFVAVMVVAMMINTICEIKLLKTVMKNRKEKKLKKGKDLQ